MTVLRRRMIRDMNLRGLAEGTQRAYVEAAKDLARHFNRSPDLLRAGTVLADLQGRDTIVGEAHDGRGQEAVREILNEMSLRGLGSKDNCESRTRG